MLSIELYTQADRALWDDFVRRSRNGTFLFERDYMEYHADRFADFSLIVRDGGAPIALLPANRRGKIAESHGGLTYGGFVLGPRLTTLRMIEVLAATAGFLREQGIGLLRYRAIPHVYHGSPAGEDLFALSASGARLVHRAALSVLDPGMPLTVQERRRRALQKASRAGLEAFESTDLEAYWTLLEEVLDKRHGARPVHSLAEIRLLRQRFPQSIRLFSTTFKGRMIAGVLVYETPRVARAQYIAASAVGRDLGALDLILRSLVGAVFAGKRYIDLGTSEGQGAAGLNEGVIQFKEGLGARTVAQDTYELPIA